MSFSGHQPYDPAAQAKVREPVLVANSGFFPDIDQSDFIGVARITDEYRDETIRAALREAMLAANQALQACLAKWQLEFPQYLRLLDIPCPTVDGIGALNLHYNAAVYAWAKCVLLREYATMNRKPQAENVGKEAEERCHELLDRFERAIAQISGYDPLTQQAPESSYLRFRASAV